MGWRWSLRHGRCVNLQSFPPILPDSSRFFQIFPDFSRFFQILPDSSRFFQILPDFSRFVSDLFQILMKILGMLFLGGIHWDYPGFWGRFFRIYGIFWDFLGFFGDFFGILMKILVKILVKILSKILWEIVTEIPVRDPSVITDPTLNLKPITSNCHRLAIS